MKNIIETMIRLHTMQKNLRKIIKVYSKRDVNSIKMVNNVDVSLPWGVLTLHALGHAAHDLSIDLSKEVEGFLGGFDVTKEQRESATHIPDVDHTNLWNPANYKEYDKEKKGK